MARERAATNHTLKKKSLLKVRIMVIDDDSTSLKIVSAMLKNCSDQDGMNIELVVFSVSNPMDALAALRMRKGNFDLVVSDLHMPEMNGMELQKHVEEEFQLPVIIMSSDDKESVILRSLEDGAAFYIVKPVNRNDLKNVWQYAVAAKKGKFTSMDDTNKSTNETSSSPDEKISYEDDDVDSASSVNEGKNGNEKTTDVKKRGKKRPKEEDQDHDDHDNDDDDDDEDNPIARKKAKVVWTNSLHNRFLQAINQIGLDKAVPKRILEFMSVPGLTRENVASHLQKYRIFLRRVAESGANPQRNFGRPRRSNFASSFASGINQPHNPQIQLPNRQPTFHPGLGWNTPATSSLTASNLSRPRRIPYNVGASRSNLPSHPSYRQSRLLGGNSSSFNRSFLGVLNPFYQGNRSRVGLESSSSTSANQFSYESANTDRLCGLTVDATRNALSDNNNAFQRFQLENQLRLNQLSLGVTTPLHCRFQSNEIGKVNPVSVVGNIGKTNANSSSHQSLGANNNYTQLWVANDGNLLGSGGHLQSSSLNRNANNGQSLLDWLHNDVSSNAGPIGNGSYGNSNYSAQIDTSGSFSSAWHDKALQLQQHTVNKENTSPLTALPPTNLEMTNIATTFNSTSDQKRLGNDAILGGFIFDANGNIINNSSGSNITNDDNNYLVPNQQQGGEGIPHTNLPNISSLSGLDTLMPQLLSSDFPISFNRQYNSPSTEQAPVKQLQGVEEVFNTNFDGNDNDNQMENLCSTSELIQGSGDIMDLELSSLLSAGNNDTPPENQHIWDEFMDSILGDDPL